MLQLYRVYGVFLASLLCANYYKPGSVDILSIHVLPKAFNRILLVGAILAGAVCNVDSPLRQSAHMDSLVEVSTRVEAAIDYATTQLQVQSEQVVTQLWPSSERRLPGACCLPANDKAALKFKNWTSEYSQRNGKRHGVSATCVTAHVQQVHPKH